MNTAYQNRLDWAEKSNKSIRSFFQRLKRKPPRNLDEQFHDAHDTAFENTACLECANCCKTTSPIFTDRDVGRLAKHLRMRPATLTEKHLTIDRDGDWVLRKAPCPFLDSDDNSCGVYEARPNACREYPHTNRKNMAGILHITEKNTAICPAVAEIVKGMMAELHRVNT